jgi:hypothetical protein
MNASLVIDQLSLNEQHELLRVLVDRLYPVGQEDENAAFPAWIMSSLEKQEQRYRAGLETADDIETVDARIRQRMIKP